MLAHYGKETGVKMARKHLGWYTKGLPGSAEFRNRVNFVDDAAEVVAMLREFYCPCSTGPSSSCARHEVRAGANGPDAQRQLASLPLAVLLLAPGQTIASANPAAEQFLGQSLRRLAGRPLARCAELRRTAPGRTARRSARRRSRRARST